MKPRTPLAAVLMFAAMVAGAQEPASHEHSVHDPAAHKGHAEEAQPPASGTSAESERAHVPPDPPQLIMHDMSEKEMIEMMGMDDTATFGMLLFDQLEWREEEDALAWDARAWFGDDYNKAVLKAEGERVDDDASGRSELLWNRVISAWWSLQAGAAYDYDIGPSRTWAAFGVQGLAPYQFEIEAHVYVGEEGRSAARFSGEYEMFLTQRWVLQPKLELNAYGKDDPANRIDSGLSEAELGFRVRYEIRREFAPYVGAVWTRHWGDWADVAGDNSELTWVAGVRAWW